MTATLTRDYTKPLPMATFAITASRAAELASQGQMVPWQGVLAVEGVGTGDGRQIEPGALRWATLPLPLMAQFENPVGGMGHDGAVLAGRIDDIVRIDENRVWARGFIDPDSPGGMPLINALDKGLMRGVSVDLDDVTVTQFREKSGKPRRNIMDARIRGATVTPFQAIVEAEISLDTEALAASGGAPVGLTARILTPISPEETLIQTLESGLVASGKIPVDPPLAWFDRRTFDRYTPLTVTANGQVFGHIAAWGTCHISFRRCEPVPRSNTNYSAFRTGKVLTAEGVEVRTGPLVMDTVHPDLMMMASDAQAFYAHSGCAVADVVPYEDEFGIAIVGAIRPGVAPEQLRALRGSDVSPDWRTVNGRHRECVALLAVNNSGFKQPASALAASAGQPSTVKRFVKPGGVAAALAPDGEVLALVASGSALALDGGGCEDDGQPIEFDDQDGFTADRRSEVTAMLIERFGPKVRRFRAPAPPPAVRTFRAPTAQFHVQHNQKDHGNGHAAPKDGLVKRTAKKLKKKLDDALDAADGPPSAHPLTRVHAGQHAATTEQLGFNPNQPRVPAGSPAGGQFAPAGGGASTGAQQAQNGIAALQQGSARDRARADQLQREWDYADGKAGGRLGALSGDERKVLQEEWDRQVRGTGASKLDQEENDDLVRTVADDMRRTLDAKPDTSPKRAARDAILTHHPDFQGPPDDSWIQRTLERQAGVGERDPNPRRNLGQPKPNAVHVDGTKASSAEVDAEIARRARSVKRGTRGTWKDGVWVPKKA